MKELPLRRLCVYCASNIGLNTIHAEHAARLGHAMAKADVGLVYGGGGEGLMGRLAAAVQKHGGHVTSIIPERLLGVDGMLETPDERHVVAGYHERKRRMLDLAHGFAALAGGPGTLEELSEQLAWLDSRAHRHPVYLLNTEGFWNELLNMLDRMREEGVAGAGDALPCVVVDDPEKLIDAFLAASTTPARGNK